MVQSTGRHPAQRRPKVRREIKWGVVAFVVALVLEYLVLPQLGGASRSLHALGRVNLAYVAAGLVLEAAALLAYAQLTHTVLPPGGPPIGRVVRIDLSTMALSHVVPGGTMAGTPLAYRLFTQSGVSGADAAFALAMQGVGSAVVLNAIFWVALLVSLFIHGYNPAYALAAGAGVVLMGTFAAVIVVLLRGHHRAADLVRRYVGRVPFLDAERLADAVQRVADRLRTLGADRLLLRRAIVWAAANWLLDAASLWVCVAAFHTLLSPIDLLVAYGLANIVAVIPITPAGLGTVEATLVYTLVGFGVPNHNREALLAVLLYRLFNFWLPIPVGGGCYLSLRFSGEGWRSRLAHARGELVVHDDEDTTQAGPPPGQPSGTSPTGAPPTGALQPAGSRQPRRLAAPGSQPPPGSTVPPGSTGTTRQQHAPASPGTIGARGPEEEPEPVRDATPPTDTGPARGTSALGTTGTTDDDERPQGRASGLEAVRRFLRGRPQVAGGEL